MITFTLHGKTESEVNERIKNYLIEFYPEGYGTFIRKPEFNDNVKCWFANGFRTLNCK